MEGRLSFALKGLSDDASSRPIGPRASRRAGSCQGLTTKRSLLALGSPARAMGLLGGLAAHGAERGRGAGLDAERYEGQADGPWGPLYAGARATHPSAGGPSTWPRFFAHALPTEGTFLHEASEFRTPCRRF